MQVAQDHDATVAARTEELKVIAEAKKILVESTGSAAAASFVQLSATATASSKASTAGKKVASMVKKLAQKQHSNALAQLASRIEAVVRYGGQAGEDVFAKIKGMIGDMITKLEEEAANDATEKAYCDEEMAKTEAKKADLEGTLIASTEQKASKMKEAMATAQFLSEVHGDCDWLLSNFDVRKSARAGEMDALTKGKAVLSGADFSLLQSAQVRRHA